MKVSSVFILLAFLLLLLNAIPIYAMREGVKLEADGKIIHDDIAFLFPFVTDWNNDGKKDLIVGQPHHGKIRLYLNYGTDSDPMFKDFIYLSAGGSEISLFDG
jgi:hypothetical protein